MSDNFQGAAYGVALNALKQIVATLGPEVPDCIKCEGCAYEWSEALRIAKDALATRAPAPGAEPVAWMFQHDETGRNCFCANDGVNTVASFIAANPRLAYVCALYTTHGSVQHHES